MSPDKHDPIEERDIEQLLTMMSDERVSKRIGEIIIETIKQSSEVVSPKLLSVLDDIIARNMAGMTVEVDWKQMLTNENFRTSVSTLVAEAIATQNG